MRNAETLFSIEFDLIYFVSCSASLVETPHASAEQQYRMPIGAILTTPTYIQNITRSLLFRFRMRNTSRHTFSRHVHLY